MSPSFATQNLPDLTGTFVDEGYLQLVQLLGCGSFAKVYKALDTTSSPDDPVFYAVKGCLISLYFHSRRRRRVHVYVLDLGAGNLLDAILQHHIYVDRPALVKEAFTEVLNAVAQCHKRGVFHRDLKTSNILCGVTRTGIQLVDFGLATREEQSGVFRCGSLAYISPECADTSRVEYETRESHLWDLSVVLFNLITSTVPWLAAELSDDKYAAYRADEDNYLVDALHLTLAANDFLRWCFAADPAGRPTLAQMREALHNIERFSFADMLPRTQSVPAATQTSVDMLSISDVLSSSLFTPELPVLTSGLHAPSSSSSGSSAGPSTPPIFGTEPPMAIVDLLDAANIGLAAVHPPPLAPTKLHSSVPMIVLPPPVKLAPEFRFLDRRKQNITTRQRFANKLRRVRLFPRRLLFILVIPLLTQLEQRLCLTGTAVASRPQRDTPRARPLEDYWLGDPKNSCSDLSGMLCKTVGGPFPREASESTLRRGKLLKTAQDLSGILGKTQDRLDSSLDDEGRPLQGSRPPVQNASRKTDSVLRHATQDSGGTKTSVEHSAISKTQDRWDTLL
ncbi:kinase-like domain-containing protein [Mycena crocata]|nr:kinase-like domain-containing protein [Mycena crocata]